MKTKLTVATLMLVGLALIAAASAQSHAPASSGRFAWIGAVYSDGMPLAFDTQTGQVCQPVVALAMSSKDAQASLARAKTEAQKAAIFNAAVTPSCLALYRQYPTPGTK